MMKYSSFRKRRTWQWIIIGFLVCLAMVILATVIARNYYNNNLQPVSNVQSWTEVTIEPGSTLANISQTLKEKKLIRNKQVFEQYVRNNGTAEDIKAGTYELSPSYSVSEIVSILTQGKIVSKLITILPGSRIDQIEKSFINAGFSEADVKKALDSANYVDHPALVDKPKDASLEGYLYPESFERTSTTTVEHIINASLNEMSKRLTPELRQAFAKKGLSTHQAVILASIVENEVSKPEDRRQVAQVFLKRLSEGTKLQSDATARYGAVINGVEQGMTHEQILHYSSPYNTYDNAGLTPGPISNVSESSLNAVANPANTDWLFFVSGDDGTTYFSKTASEHEALTKQHCKQLCGN